jgi:hypothetical protein
MPSCRKPRSAAALPAFLVNGGRQNRRRRHKTRHAATITRIYAAANTASLPRLRIPQPDCNLTGPKQNQIDLFEAHKRQGRHVNP